LSADTSPSIRRFDAPPPGVEIENEDSLSLSPQGDIFLGEPKIAEKTIQREVIIVHQELPPSLDPETRFLEHPSVIKHLNGKAREREDVKKGFGSEIRVGRLLDRHHLVASVRQTEHGGSEDVLEMTDLFVTMDPKFVIPYIRAQVKSHPQPVDKFSQSIFERASKDIPNLIKRSRGERYRKIKEWLMAKRIVIINGGPNATDEEIIASFFGQVAQIVAYERRQKVNARVA